MNGHVIASNVFSIIGLTILSIFPVFLILNYPCRSSKLKDKEYDAKFSELYSDFDLSREGYQLKFVLLYPFVFVLKRLVLALICILLENYVAIQVVSFYVMTLLVVVYLMLT